MKWPFRVTPPLVDVVEALAHTEGKVHGWRLAEQVGQSPPNVYRALERLRLAGWVDYEWEEQNPKRGKPARRLCWLTEEGKGQVGLLLVERRSITITVDVKTDEEQCDDAVAR